MFKLREFLKPYIKETVIGSGAKLFEAILELLLPIFMGKIIDIGIVNKDMPYIGKMALIMFVVISIGLASASLCQYYASYTCQNVGNDIRKELLRKISLFSYADIDRFGNSTLINRMTNDVNQVVLAVAMLIRLVSRAPFLCIGAIVMSIYIAPKMSLIFLILIPIFILVIAVIMKRTIPLYKNAQGKMDNLGHVLKENLTGVRVIRAFARHENESERIKDATEEVSKAYIKVTNLSALMNPITSLIMNIGIIVLLYVGGINVNIGTLTQGDIVVLINYITQVLLALIVVANLLVTFTKASASSVRINEVLEYVPSIKDEEYLEDVSEELTINKEIVTFDNVTFKYNSEEVLSDLSFSIKKGEVFGIVGTTGSGKSTVANLIPRFYDIKKGSIKIDNIDIKNYTLESLRQNISVVFQDNFLFAGTIKDNILMGKLNATQEELNHAIDNACLREFINELPEGINTYIGEKGVLLSGGQKQRIAIARAFIKNAPIIILDEATSALDNKSEAIVQKAINNLMKDKTVFVIAHRLSTIKNATKILTINEGTLSEQGTHQELMNIPNGKYKTLYEMQFGKTG